jgi:hypothetical protein
MIPASSLGPNTQSLIREVAGLTGGMGAGGDLMAGFSFGGLIAGLVFGGVGFVAFVYGKKNAELKPMVLGILLMVYPLFVRNTMVLCVAGVVLTAALFLWRD